MSTKRGDDPGTLLDINPLVKQEHIERRQAKRRHQVLGAWLNGYVFTHYVHVSFPKGSGLKATRKHVEGVFGRLRSRAKTRLEWVIVIEKGPRGGLYHVHGLVYAPGMTVEDMRAPWGNVVTDVDVYDRDRGGAWYVVKEIAQGGGEDILFSPRLPPLFIPPSGQSTARGELEEVSFS